MRIAKLGGKGFKDAWVVLPDRKNNPVAVVMTRYVLDITVNKVITLPLLLQPGEKVTVIIPLDREFINYSQDIASLVFGLNNGFRLARSKWEKPISLPVLDIDNIIYALTRRAVTG